MLATRLGTTRNALDKTLHVARGRLRGYLAHAGYLEASPIQAGSLTPETVQRLLRDTRPWLSYDDCFHLLDQYVETLLAGPDVAWPATEHLAGCSACAEEAVSLLLLAAHDTDVDPAAALRRLPAT